MRNDLNVVDAEDLANDIARMRALLVNELTGDSAATAISNAAANPGSSASKYQEMLAKARAEKTGQ